MLQVLKDYAIAHGMESWARPLWARLTGKRIEPDPYDLQTFTLIRRYLRPDSLCLDIGCHKGLVLDVMIRQCPKGRFHAFEPAPALAAILRTKYRNQSQVVLHEVALSSQSGTAEFFFDLEVPGRSGLRDTSDDRETHKTEVKLVPQASLDSILLDTPVDFVKMDVEGAELGVLQGGAKMFRKHTPLTVFEHSKFGACHYDTKPQDVFRFFTEIGMQVSLMARLLAGQPPLTEAEFSTEHNNDTNSYFVAYGPRHVMEGSTAG